MKPRSCTGLLATLSLMFFLPHAQAKEGAPLGGIVMRAGALTTNDGFVYCDLYDKEQGFPDEPKRAVARVKVRPVERKITCVFPGVKPGRYAVALWHDVDGDGEFDTNWLGIPTEPVGVSNNAKGTFGPPSFEDAAFDYKPPLVQQDIRME